MTYYLTLSYKQENKLHNKIFELFTSLNLGSLTDLEVYQTLLVHKYTGDGKNFNLGVKWLHEKTKINQDTIKDCLERLQEKGLIQKTQGKYQLSNGKWRNRKLSIQLTNHPIDIPILWASVLLDL